MLNKQQVPIVVGQGLNQKVDSKFASFQTALELENFRLTKEGRIEKRFGFEELPALPETPSQLFTFQNSTLLASAANSSQLYQFLPSLNSWKKVGALSGLSQTVTPVVSSTEENYLPDFCELGKFQGIVFTVAGKGCRFLVLDKETGRQIYSASLGATSARAKIISNQTDTFYVIYCDGSAFRCQTFNVNTQILSGVVAIGTIDASNLGCRILPI